MSKRAWVSVVRWPQVLPALQGDRDVAVSPDEIVKGAEVEFLALLHSRFREEFRDLEFADLIGDGLAGAGGGDRFLARGSWITKSPPAAILLKKAGTSPPARRSRTKPKSAKRHANRSWRS